MAGTRELMRVGACAALVAMAGGCSKSSDRSWFGSKGGATVQAGDFAGDASEAPEVSAPTVRREASKMPLKPVGEARVIGATPAAVPAPVVNLGGTATGAGGVTPARPQDLQTTVGNSITAQAPSAAGTAATVESVVGQINGRPVFASELLEPLDGALRAAAEKAKDANSWKLLAAEAIVPELKRRVADELILSEARRNLSPEQRQGLLHFLGQIESSLISQNAGSEVKADEQLREQNGRSLNDEARDIVDKELIRNEMSNRVLPRVAVPWRDVQNEYEKQHDKWYPPAEYTFRMIYVPTSNTEGVQKIQSLLAAGTPFEKAAEDAANEWSRKEQGVWKRKTTATQAEAEFSVWPDVNAAMRTMSVGQTVGPIEFAPDKSRPAVKRTAWIHLDGVDQKAGTSLYDAQLDVENGLRDQRTTAEQQRYFEKLWKRGNVSRLENMVDKLMVVATERYAGKYRGK